MNSPWRIELFGGLQLVRGDAGGETISRFQTRKTAALLAYLAFHRERPSAREVLADIFWPDNDPEAARNSLRVALNSLRRQLEPPDVPSGAVLVADRTTVRLNPAAFVTDVAEFESALRAEKAATDDPMRAAALTRAADAYRGPLLVGWYEEWIDLEQTRLAEAYSGVLRRLTALLIKTGAYDAALEYAGRAVHSDPLREDTHRSLMRVYAALGRPEAAREQYQKLEQTLRDEMDTSPSAVTRELLRQIVSGEVTAAAAAAPLSSVPESAGDAAGVAAPLIAPKGEPPQAAPRSVATAGGAAVAAETAAVAAAASSGVPMQFTRFYGRDEEIAQVLSLLTSGDSQAGDASTAEAETARLVTLTGPGGTGKTRLAIEIASRCRDAFHGRAWFAPLSELIDGAQVGPALLAALRLAPQPDVPPLEQIAEAVGDAPALLALDNLEQMTEIGAEWAQLLRDRLPNLRLLVTSRQRLGVRDEREIVLAPLPVPASVPVTGAGSASSGGAAAVVPVEELPALIACPSIAMFLDRARAVRADFQITPRNAEAIVDLCRRLDGLPLAIELAAAWVRLLSPHQMRERLAERYDLLTSERRENTGPRQRSLRAVMEESWRLLPDDLRPFFGALSVFHGGWTLTAAEAVTGEIEALEMTDMLQQRSLVALQAVSGGNEGGAEDFADGDGDLAGTRFGMLEMVRHYAAETLEPERQTALAAAHRRFFADLAAEAGPNLSGAHAESWRDRLEADHDNLRAALASALQSDPPLALAMASSLWRFWYARGHAEEGLRLLERALSAYPDDATADKRSGAAMPVPLRALALHGAGRLALSLGRASLAGSRLAEAARRLAEADAPPTLRAMVATDRALAARARGDAAEEMAAYGELADLYHDAGDLWARGRACLSLADAVEVSGDGAEADRLRREAALCAPDLARDEPSLAAAMLELGEVTAAQGDYAASLPMLREARDLSRLEGDEEGEALALERIANAALAHGDWAGAREAAEESLVIRQSFAGRAGGEGADAAVAAAHVAFLRRLLQQAAEREEEDIRR